ncbi:MULTISPECIES: helix-turn-helix transcriptional regulator [Yersinia]|jgi:DNA-binding NarL/FixJ family response regulator|uniref:LuxR family regulatory protein n=3 Tax=Yersinia intermedia TaxID=631 RepID=A0A0T9MX83_YERIN|nr:MULTISPECIES: LuxR C-terminal-related transcriptional regulator [Yersinia]AJJ18561.1 bacterial regulatory s, luxR family protein [Yersinia intermedia]ARB86693.2 DNA-binding response regulator [Yersinia sp. FDAARGOS_228]AVL34456.1 DNA-binding response regulator [Yersinia intermedia]MCB5299498.1 LuxR C-terminal-related transcriptional regulator [Yersinia intermedia]MDA5481549.1 LuxR C-terminal-related transcriptional regulator [Yersinia intermedia]
MFYCNIETMDNYFRYGLFILLEEALAKNHVQQPAILAGNLSEETEIVFIDADSNAFYQTLEQACCLKRNESLTIFIILNSQNTFLLRNVEPNTVSGIFYKTDEEVEIVSKISQVLKLCAKKDASLTPSIEWPVYTGFHSEPFTSNESIVLELLKRGFSGSHISRILGKSEKTVSHHKRSAMKKLGVQNIVELFRQIH